MSNVVFTCPSEMREQTAERWEEAGGRRLASGFLSLNSNASGANGFLTGSANEARSSFFAPPGLQGASFGSILFDQAGLQYFDVGSAPILATVTEVSAIGNGSTATASGYLLDCATTPCEAIAPLGGTS